MGKCLVRLLLTYTLFFCLLIQSVAQERPNYEADIRRGTKTADEFRQELEGNVVLRQGDIVITCDKAVYFPNTNQSVLTGSVVLTQESLKLYSDRLNYDGNTKISDSPGNVRIEDGPTTLIADKGVYFGEPKVAEFKQDVFIEDDSVMIDASYIRYEKITGNSYGYGSVFIRGKFSNTKLFCDTVEYSPDNYQTIATGNPILQQIDTIGVNPDYIDESELENKYLFDTLTVSCDSMDALRYPYDEQYSFIENVIVTKGDLALKCDKGYYFKDRDYFRFTGTPVIWYEESQLYGDSIIVNTTATNKLKNIQSYYNALMASETDTIYSDRINQLVGEYIDMKFDEGDISNVTSFGKSKSLYFFIDENGPDGAIQIISDKAEIIFSENEIIDMHITSDPPKNDGVKFPENEIEPDPSSKNLPGFRWNPDKPVQKTPPKR